MHKKQTYTTLVFTVLLLLLISIWSVEVANGKMPYIDQWTREFVDSVTDTKFYFIFRAITELGSRQFLIPFTVLGALVLMFLHKNWFAGFLFAGGTLGTYLLNMLIKETVQRGRPSILVAANAEGYSFPSGHAMIPLVCYGLFAYFIVQKIASEKKVIAIKTAFALLIFLIGISRYVINVHYLTDVAAGFMIGALLLKGLISLFRLLNKNV